MNIYSKSFWGGFWETTRKLRWVYFIGVPLAFALGLYIRFS